MHHDRGIAGMAAEAGSRELTSRATNKAERVTSKWPQSGTAPPAADPVFKFMSLWETVSLKH